MISEHHNLLLEQMWYVLQVKCASKRENSEKRIIILAFFMVFQRFVLDKLILLTF